MQRRGVLCIVPVLLIAASSVAAAQDSVRIHNLESGLICWDGRESHVCSMASTITVAGQDRCVFGGREIACTWYGYSFDYEAPSDTVTLQCTWSSTSSLTVGNPDSVLAEDSSGGVYELPLTGGSGHFINPQYAGLDARASLLGTTTQLRQACAYDGVGLLEVVFDLHYTRRR